MDENNYIKPIDPLVLNALVEEVLANENKPANKSATNLFEYFETHKAAAGPDMEEFDTYYQEEYEHELSQMNALNAMNGNPKPAFYPKSLFMNTPRNCRVTDQLNNENFLDHDQIPEPRFLPLDHDKRLLEDQMADQLQYSPDDFTYDMSLSGEIGEYYPMQMNFADDNSKKYPGMVHKSTSGFVFPEPVSKTTIQSFIKKAMKSEEQLNNLITGKLSTDALEANNNDSQAYVKLHSNAQADVGNLIIAHLVNLAKIKSNDKVTKKSNSCANVNATTSCSKVGNLPEKMDTTKLNDSLARVERTNLPLGIVQLRRTKSEDAIKNDTVKETKEANIVIHTTSEKASQSLPTPTHPGLTRAKETSTQTSEHGGGGIYKNKTNDMSTNVDMRFLSSGAPNEKISDSEFRTLPVLQFLQVPEGSKAKENEIPKKKKSKKVSCLNAIFRGRLGRKPKNENRPDDSNESDDD